MPSHRTDSNGHATPPNDQPALSIEQRAPLNGRSTDEQQAESAVSRILDSACQQSTMVHAALPEVVQLHPDDPRWQLLDAVQRLVALALVDHERRCHPLPGSGSGSNFARNQLELTDVGRRLLAEDHVFSRGPTVADVLRGRQP